MVRNLGPWSVPSGQQPAASPAIRRSHASGEVSGASDGRTRVQPSGSACRGPG